MPTSATFVMNSEVDLSTDIVPVAILFVVSVALILLVSVVFIEVEVSDFDSLAESAFCTLSLLLLLHAKTKGRARQTIALFFIIFFFLINWLISKRLAENFMPVKNPY